MSENLNKMTKAQLIKKVLDMKGLNDLAMHVHEHNLEKISALEIKVEAWKEKHEIAETVNRGYIEKHIENLPNGIVEVENLKSEIKSLKLDIDVHKDWNYSNEIEKRDVIIQDLKNKIVGLVK